MGLCSTSLKLRVSKFGGNLINMNGEVININEKEDLEAKAISIYERGMFAMEVPKNVSFFVTIVKTKF